jgi:predicted MFS family arabinose efflux permease
MSRSVAAEDPVDLNSFRSLATAILLGVIGPEVFIVQPGFVQGLIQYVGFDEQGAGYTASVEMFGIAATTVALIFLTPRLDWRKLLRASLLLMFVANAVCAYVHDLQAFAALRFIAGIGAGGVISLSFTAIGLTRNTDRNFGLLITWVLVYGAIVLLAMPSVLEAVGMSGVLWFFALFPLVALPLIRYMPRSGTQISQVATNSVDIGSPMKGFALLSMFTYNLAQGVVWTDLFVTGVNAGLGEQQVANGLTVSQFAGIGGAFFAALLAHRTNHVLGLGVSITASALVLYPLIGGFEAMLYGILVSIYNFAWNFTQPVLLSAMAHFDRSGRVVVFAVAAQMLGLAAGPSVAATVLGKGGLPSVIWVGIGLFLASLVFILPPVLAQRRARHIALA